MDKVQLFDEEQEDNDLNDEKTFIDDRILLDSEQFSEEKTSKLIELKSRLAHDDRFKIDKRFIDDDTDDHNHNDPKAISPIEAEKQKNFEILQQIIGKPVSTNKYISRNLTGLKKQTLFIPRFDPTKEECKELELSNDSKYKRKISDSLEIDSKVLKQKIDLEKVVKTKQDNNVSQDDCYYEVQSNLKDLFGGTSEFSFGTILEPIETIQNKNELSVSESLASKQLRFPLQNPFKYDSSSSDDNNDDNDDKIQLGLTEIFDTKTGPSSSFFLDFNDQKICLEDQFFSKELVEKVQEDAPQRQLRMMRALSLRKKSLLKNKRTAEKYSMKKKLQKRFIVANMKRKKKFHQKRIQWSNKKN